jgi:hypothetical protein
VVLAGRAQRLPGDDQVIDQVDWHAGRQALSGEPTPADRRVVSVGDEISLGNPPDEDRGHAEGQRHGAGQRPDSLIAHGDRVARRDGPGKFPGDEGEVGGASQDALEVGEAAPSGPSFPVKDLEVIADAAQPQLPGDAWLRPASSLQLEGSVSDIWRRVAMVRQCLLSSGSRVRILPGALKSETI